MKPSLILRRLFLFTFALFYWALILPIAYPIILAITLLLGPVIDLLTSSFTSRSIPDAFATTNRAVLVHFDL